MQLLWEAPSLFAVKNNKVFGENQSLLQCESCKPELGCWQEKSQKFKEM